MNVLKIVAVIAVIIAIAAAAIYIMLQFEQTKPIAEAATGLAGQAQEYVTNNLPTVIAGAGTVTAIGGAALSKVNTAKEETAKVATDANSQITGLLGEKDKLEKEVEAQKTQLESVTAELEETKTTAQNSLSIIDGQKNEIQRLKTSNQELLDKLAHTPVNVVEVVK